LYYDFNAAKFIKLSRLCWLGHVQRTSKPSVLKEIFSGRPAGSRSIERPKLRWLDGVERDLRLLEVDDWRSMAEDRVTWRSLLEEAKTHTGL
jgi:hypothetical protein